MSVGYLASSASVMTVGKDAFQLRKLKNIGTFVDVFEIPIRGYSYFSRARCFLL
jgi:hypothetical protein